MQLNKHGSFYIRHGWPTKIIDAIAHDAHIFTPYNELNAVDYLGVGRVMIKAMRYWALVLGLAEEAKDQHGIINTLTDIGTNIANNDPYCQDRGTLWLLHRNLARDTENATAWGWAFNNFNTKTFKKEDFSKSLYLYIQKQGAEYSRKAVEKEFDCFKNTYASDKAFDIDKVIDEDTIPFFAPLRLIEHLGGGRFEKRRTEAKDIPLKVFLYCILSDNIERLRGSAELTIDTLLEGENQVGKYMCLNYAALLELLQKLENDNSLSLINNFGNRYIHIHENNAQALLNGYFQGILR